MFKGLSIVLLLSLLMTTITAFQYPPSNPNEQRLGATSKKAVSIKWLSLEEALEKSEKAPKKIFLYIHKAYCGWCQHMDKSTLSEASNINYLNENFYPVRFDAEFEGSIKFGDKVFKPRKKDGKSFHEFADYIAMGHVSTPTIAFLDKELNVLQAMAGYKDPATFETIITYYGGDHFLNTPWSMYLESYIPLSERQSASEK
ncbi:MAG: thioredoxin family protein [Bacteroidota bacterium]